MNDLPLDLLENIWSYLHFKDIKASITTIQYKKYLKNIIRRGNLDEIKIKKCEECQRVYVNGESFNIKTYNNKKTIERCSIECKDIFINKLPRCYYCLSPVQVKPLANKYYCSSDCQRNVIFKRPRYYTC